MKLRNLEPPTNTRENNDRKFKATGGRGAFDASTKQTSFLRPLVEPAEAQQGHVPP